jgi:hypothetical protein
MERIASQADAHAQRKRSPIFVGFGAAAVAACVTLGLMVSHSAPGIPVAQSISSTKECQLVPRKLLVSTTQGSGTVRFRASGYVSAPFTLTAQPQPVIFPLPRPDSAPVEEQIAIEGNARNLVLTSEVSEFRRVFDTVNGTEVLTVFWKPMKSC